MFSIDKNIEDLSIRERKIIKVFFSMNNHQVATPEMMLEEARSYILFFREERGISAYIALHLLLTDRKLYYAHSSNPFDAGKLNGVQEEALVFAEGLGAMLDELDFSKLSDLEQESWIDSQEIFTPKPKTVPEAEPQQKEESAPEDAVPATQEENAVEAPEAAAAPSIPPQPHQPAQPTPLDIFPTQPQTAAAPPAPPAAPPVAQYVQQQPPVAPSAPPQQTAPPVQVQPQAPVVQPTQAAPGTQPAVPPPAPQQEAVQYAPAVMHAPIEQQPVQPAPPQPVYQQPHQTPVQPGGQQPPPPGYAALQPPHQKPAPPYAAPEASPQFPREYVQHQEIVQSAGRQAASRNAVPAPAARPAQPASHPPAARPGVQSPPAQSISASSQQAPGEGGIRRQRTVPGKDAKTGEGYVSRDREALARLLASF
ncbi:MAG TPA: hypothetical protein VK654_16850 [Nitrospirota bacterium]|nr:hypothetical protein [Nitrospirota bacterium]